jgi:hypothetical protein
MYTALFTCHLATERYLGDSWARQQEQLDKPVVHIMLTARCSTNNGHLESWLTAKIDRNAKSSLATAKSIFPVRQQED